MSFFECLERDEFFVIICKDSDKRKFIHQYIESNYPKTNNIGLCLEKFDKERRRFIKCYECEKDVSILPENYRYGYEENNKDEYYHLECSNCGECQTWEPNYDGYDDVKCFDANNCILIGNYMNLKYTPKKSFTFKTVTKDEIKDIVDSCEIKIIKRPDKILRKKHLQEYIDSQI